MFINWWMGKQNVVYLYNGILLSHKKKWSTNTCDTVNEPWNHYVKWKKPDTRIIWFHLHENSWVGKFLEKESR